MPTEDIDSQQGRSRRRRAVRGSTELREAILATTDRLMVETGDVHDVSIDAITRAVGCTPPALYHHFTDKDSLLREVSARAFGRFAAELNAAVAGVDDPLEALRARGVAYFHYGLEHPEHYRILFMGRVGDLPSVSDNVEPGAGLRDLIANVQACIDAGTWAPGDPLIMATGLWALVHGLTSLALSNPAIPIEFMEHSLDFSTRALHRGFATTTEGGDRGTDAPEDP